MIVDVHCHLALPARRMTAGGLRFSFEPVGAQGRPGMDAYLPTGMRRGLIWRYFAHRLGLDLHADEPVLDAQVEDVARAHWLATPSVDRVVLLAFDEYHTDEGVALGAVGGGAGWRARPAPGSSLYASNSLVRQLCAEHPDKLCFGASIHPYRPHALAAVDEVADAGAVLLKWLPLTQNIDARDPRTQAFVRRLGERGLPLLVHFGGEVTLVTQRPEQQNPQPLLDCLRRLHREGCMPPTIVAHAATPAYPGQAGTCVRQLLDAVRGPLRTAPLYADVAALYWRPYWLHRLLRDPTYAPLRDRLVFGSDFPVLPTALLFPRARSRHYRWFATAASWIERSYRILRAVGLPDEAFHRGAEALASRLGEPS